MDARRLWRRSTRKHEEICRGRRWDDGDRSEEGYHWGRNVREYSCTQSHPCVYFEGGVTPATATSAAIPVEKGTTQLGRRRAGGLAKAFFIHGTTTGERSYHDDVL